MLYPGIHTGARGRVSRNRAAAFRLRLRSLTVSDTSDCKLELYRGILRLGFDPLAEAHLHTVHAWGGVRPRTPLDTASYLVQNLG